MVEPKSRSGFVTLLTPHDQKVAKSASGDSLSSLPDSDEEEIHSDIEVGEAVTRILNLVFLKKRFFLFLAEN